MKTYQDFQKEGTTDQKKMDFVRSAINDHRSSATYKMAVDADAYDRQQNVTITTYQKFLYTMSGDAIPDTFSANYKLASNFFNRLTTQRNQFLLGNGVTFQKPETKEQLGEDFDQKMIALGHEAQKGGVSFAFWNLDHMEVFSLTEFVPLYDEENGALMAGIRFWQIDTNKPLRATLYELDGLTDYIWTSNKPNGEQMDKKQTYIVKSEGTPADGEYIYKGENYETFPIIPLFNINKQSDLVGMRSNIDAYDLIKSGFANTIDEASLFYWTITNAGGMDETDLAKFQDSLRRVKAAMIERNGAQVEAHTMEAPYMSRESYLDRARADLYEDYMALDTKNIASGSTTATQIQASYEPLNSKTDDYEAQITSFILRLLSFLGIEDKPTYTRSMIVNKTEEIQSILSSAVILPEQYATKKILTILGDADALQEVERLKMEEEIERQSLNENEGDDEWQDETKPTETQTER